MRIGKYLLLLFSILLVAAQAHAQSGCGDSPECPTAILALAGSAGVVITRAYSRFKARK
jgi:XrtJ-associated TM-motif-TM protein